MNRFFSFSTVVVLLLSTQNCVNNSKSDKPSTTAAAETAPFSPIVLPTEFNAYWYQGQAELCVYDVVQDRYGEIRQAEQVNIFVTEDFSGSKQVKLDNPDKAGKDRVPILKLNALRRFETGIYDYSIMQSVFTPVSGAATIKTSTSIQDWCGQVFMQNNLTTSGYRSRIYSYFETEGDQDITLPLVLMEDELWSRLRLNPSAIPTGKQKVLPSAVYGRLLHKPVIAQEADIQIEKGETESVIRLQYETIPRSLQIRFESAFPYKITGWEEKNNGKLASQGTLKSTRKSAYWSEHDNVHAPLRDSMKIGHRK